MAAAMGPTSGFLGAGHDAVPADGEADAATDGQPPMARNVTVDCGWGRMIFGQTFDDHDRLAATLADEQPGRRDVCLYAPEAHVLVSQDPDQLFIDPSYTYRLLLEELDPSPVPTPTVDVRSMEGDGDAHVINHIYARCGMVAAPISTRLENQCGSVFTYLLAIDPSSGAVLGTVTGIDHTAAFGDPHGDTSLWCLAVDPQAPVPGIGELLVRALARHYGELGRHHLDLSVMHDNDPAVALYEKLGFTRVPVLCVKRKNSINESLSELTSAVAMSRCDDKRATRALLARAGLRVPQGQAATGGVSDLEFLEAAGSVVVKPARGEQGRGVTVAVNRPDALARAVEHARTFCPDVLLEEYLAGHDLRLVVIDGEVVAAAIRAPAAGVELAVRRTANLHTGGTIHDLTDRVHPDLVDAAVLAAQSIGIPVTGIDLIVPDVEGADYVFIEANERPGLANHEPQPTAERFLDLLFPGTEALPCGWDPDSTSAGEMHVPDQTAADGTTPAEVAR